MLEEAGAVRRDFTNSGPIAGPEVAAAASIPVIGGFGGGLWLDGRVRMGHAVIGYGAKHLDEEIETYANVARITLDAINAFAGDVRVAGANSDSIVTGRLRIFCVLACATRFSSTARFGAIP